jgi:peptide/nickel transport system ATP-binding protein
MLPEGGRICAEQIPPWRFNSEEHRVYCHIPLQELRKMEPVVTAG